MLDLGTNPDSEHSPQCWTRKIVDTAVVRLLRYSDQYPTKATSRREGLFWLTVSEVSVYHGGTEQLVSR